MLVEMKGQLARHLFNKKFLSSENYKSETANLNSNNEALVRAIICSGLYPNVAKVLNLTIKSRKKAWIVAWNQFFF